MNRLFCLMKRQNAITKGATVVQEKIGHLKEIMSSWENELSLLTQTHEAVVKHIKANTHPRWVESDLASEQIRYSESSHETRGKIYGLYVALKIIEDKWGNLR